MVPQNKVVQQKQQSAPWRIIAADENPEPMGHHAAQIVEHRAIVCMPNAKQVSDHFHLDKRLGDNMVEVIQKMICQTDGKLPYPCPLEGEAKSYIMEDIYDIGDAKHRKMVCNYYAARHMQDEGFPLKDIAERLNIKSRQVYKLLHTDIKKALNDDQLKILRQTPELARIINSGSITPQTIKKKMEGELSLKLICRATRRLRDKYRELRKQVRIHNKDPKNVKETKVTVEAIRKYIMTGITTSEKLLRLKQTQPNIDKILQACISFRRMIAGLKDFVYIWLCLFESEQLFRCSMSSCIIITDHLSVFGVSNIVNIFHDITFGFTFQWIRIRQLAIRLTNHLLYHFNHIVSKTFVKMEMV